MNKSIMWIVCLPAIFSLGCHVYFGRYKHLPVHVSLSGFDLAFLVILAVFLLFVLVASAFQQIYFLGLKGKTGLALQLSRGFFLLPKIKRMLEAMILFNAGRYGEARERIRHDAFDEADKPRLKSRQIYIYALCCCNDGKEAEAEKYLQGAVEANPEKSAMKSACVVALVVSLLMQKKDVQRASSLMEQEVANLLVPMRSGDKARRFAVLAWALAASMRKKEAELAVAQALELSAKHSATDRAGVLYTTGEAWHALGEDVFARQFFAQSLELRENGVTALSSRKALARMDALAIV